MQSEPEFAIEYDKFMTVYERLGHKRLLDEAAKLSHGERVSYLPHHGIWQDADRTKNFG